MALTLTRDAGQSVLIGDITVTFHPYRGRRARLTIDAPADVKILRPENADRPAARTIPAAEPVELTGQIELDPDGVAPGKPAPSGTARVRRHSAELENPIDVYLACPYTHPQQTVRTHRFLAATAEAVRILRYEGLVVFSPITHTHEMCTRHDLPVEYDFWARSLRAFLLHSRELRVLRLPGWAFSEGVRDEIRLADRYNIPVTYTDPLAAAK